MIKRKKNKTFLLFCLFISSSHHLIIPSSVVFCEGPEIHMGIKERFNSGRVTKYNLGMVEARTTDGDTHSLHTIIHADLVFSGKVEINPIKPKDRAKYPDPVLSLSVKKSSKGILVSTKLTALKETLYSKNINTTSKKLRQTGHEISHDVLKNLIGESSFFKSKIAFIARQKSVKELWISDYDGKEKKKLTSFKTITFMPAFSPDGKKLAFTSYKDGNPDLYSLDLANYKVFPISRKQGLNICPAWDPKNKGLAVTMSLKGNSDIYFIDPKGKILKTLIRNSSVDTSPSFSPNGEELTFTSDRSGNPQVFVMQRDGTNIRRLTFGFYWADQAVWSPDGTAIAFAAKRTRAENFQVYITDPLGMSLLELTQEGSNEHPSFSPDGRFIVFSTNRNNRGEIYLKGIAPQTNPMKWISMKGYSFSQPTWGP
ncbi:DPP IV N-terminal domain-containing protein [Elusimicrobiota bacterium]